MTVTHTMTQKTVTQKHTNFAKNAITNINTHLHCVTDKENQ